MPGTITSRLSAVNEYGIPYADLLRRYRVLSENLAELYRETIRTLLRAETPEERLEARRRARKVLA